MKSDKKTVEISVTATFEVTFKHPISLQKFEDLCAGKTTIQDVVDESYAYAAISSQGTCEMDWDYSDADR